MALRSSDEIPYRYPIELCFTLPSDKRNPHMEQEVRNGLKNSFVFKRYLLSKEIKQTNTRMVMYLLIGFGFLLAGTLLSNHFEGKLLLSLLADEPLLEVGCLFGRLFLSFFSRIVRCTIDTAPINGYNRHQLFFEK